MNALTWSTTIAALMFGGSVFAAEKPAAEKPAPAPNVILIETEGTATKPALIKLAEPRQGKSGEVGRERFYIEIVDKKPDQEKTEGLAGKSGESAGKPQRGLLVAEEAPEHDRYWIGLMARPLTTEERNKLNVQGESGLVIEEIMPNSPAANANLKPHDVLWKAGTTGLKKLADLSDVVRNAKGRNIAIEYQRDGKRQTIAVKTAKLPGGEFEGLKRETVVLRPDQFTPEALRKLAAGLKAGQSFGGAAAGPERFSIEIVDKKADQAKNESLAGKSGESADKPRGGLLVAEEAPEHDRFWIGLEARPLTTEERNKLNVQGEWGLAIEEIMPNSPAANANLKPHDVLWKAGTTGLKTLADLADVVRNAKGRNIAIEYQRDGGKRQTIAVKTAKRPDGELEDLERETVVVRADQLPPDAATIAKLAAEIASRQSLKTQLAGGAGTGPYGPVDPKTAERHGPVDPKTGDQIKTLLAQRRELQARAKELNEKLKAVSEGREATAQAEPIQAQLRIASQQIEAINRQAVALELSRGSSDRDALRPVTAGLAYMTAAQSRGAPDRDALRRQLSTLRHCASELAEVGRTEEASHLMSKSHDLEEQLESSSQDRQESSVERMVITRNPTSIRAWGLKEPESENPATVRFWYSKLPDADQIRLTQIKSAMQLLAQAGLREDAEHLQQKADVLEKEQKVQQQRREIAAKLVLEPQSAATIAELRNQVEQMHRELQEIKDAVARLSEQKK